MYWACFKSVLSTNEKVEVLIVDKQRRKKKEKEEEEEEKKRKIELITGDAVHM